MQSFATLYEALDTTTSTRLKLDAMVGYFRSAEPRDAAWAAWILSGRRHRRFIGPAALRRWLVEAAGLPEWLVEEAYAGVGDTAETIALLMDGARAAPEAATDTATDAHSGARIGLADWIESRLLPLRGADEPTQRARIQGWWRELPYRECFLLNKLMTGALRVGVSELLVTRAIAEALGLQRAEVMRRMMGNWEPGAAWWQGLAARRDAGGGDSSEATDPAAPYPFFLASPLDAPPAETLGARELWQAEWKWDGIRGQLVRRAGQCFLWSRGEELVTERFPEIVAAALSRIPDGTVLDGEILVWRDGRALPFAELQRRIGRTKLSARLLADIPARFLAYDLLEHGHRDLREAPLTARRAALEALLHEPPAALALSPLVEAADWARLAELRAESRSRAVEGLMLKRLDAPYGLGRQRGHWWKWKIEPWSIDAVMLYAQPGAGRRSNLHTDYTFGAWRGTELVPIAKAYSGLDDAEIAELDRWIRAHTRERFGPVRAVETTQVFEIAFEGIAASPRHRSGVALRFPRILRWRRDKPAQEADTLESLQELLRASRSGVA